MAICGIYIIKNLINNKVYIGQSRDIYRRWRQHKHLAKSYKGNKNYLYNSMQKYGIENFKFSILKECKVEELNEMEIYYIKKYKSLISENGYNIYSDNFYLANSSKINENKLKSIIKLLKDKKLTKVEIAKKHGVSVRLINSINQGSTHFKNDCNYPIRKFSEYEIKLNDIKKYNKSKSKCLYCEKNIYTITNNSSFCDKNCKCLYLYNKRYTGYCLACNKKLINNNLLYCSMNCSHKNLNKLNISKKDLYNELCILPNFSKIGAKYGVSSNTIIKKCKKLEIPHKIKHYKELYEKENGKKYNHNI